MAKKSKFNVGDVLSLTHYVRVDKVNGDGSLSVTDVDRNLKFNIKGNDILDSIKSAVNFTKTEKLTQSEVVEKLIHSNGLPFTVKFKKADGKLRELTGRYLKHEALLGRSHVHDFGVTSGTPLRLVDHRTIEWLVIDGVKYEVK